MVVNFLLFKAKAGGPGLLVHGKIWTRHKNSNMGEAKKASGGRMRMLRSNCQLTPAPVLALRPNRRRLPSCRLDVPSAVDRTG
ncbi:hypothetical protein V8C43DRAFT_288680 [Trichoderma afarasin]